MVVNLSKLWRLLFPLVGLMVVSALADPARAAENDDHGATQAFPRAYGTFQYMNVVGVAARGRLLVYLDHADTNAPVIGASVSATSSDRKWALTEPARGVYVAEGFALPTGPVRVTVAIAMSETRGDVALEFNPAAGSGENSAAAEESRPASLSVPLLSAGAVLLVGLGLGGYLVWDRRRRRVTVLAIAPGS